ncbi:M9 family metallopeptidase [Kitasatospora sp. SUK 42]|uniref:M9 family metallopeptidase n=1 Tax=Kitasatospora sp. SUK 42 TaxID=1588882 RepID=UPI0018C8E5A9|nr:M9 family metallopeptidase [Kitasatospora sp. SUK 42]MBV2155174.1 M9 family metallopeptidase [Kitasatospora sp. SUK 42]
MRPFRIAKARARSLPALGAAFFLALGLLSPQAHAAPTAPTPPTPAPAKAAPHSIPLPKSPDTPKDPRPLPSDLRTKGSAPTAGSAVGAARTAKQLTASACDTSAFTGNSGAALVQQVKAASLDCVNTLFKLTGNDAKAAFNEAQMATVANALRDTATTYPGDDSTSAGQLVLFLRAGYYVQWYNKDTVGPYGATLQTAIRGALDGFFAAPHSKDVTEANGATLAEAVTLIDSAQENARYTGVVKRLLNDYTGAWTGSMATAVANTETVIERGFDQPAFVSALQADPSFATTMASFVTRNSTQINGADPVTSIGIQLGNLVANDALRAQGRPILKDLINRYPLVGNTGPLTMNLLWFTEKKDAGNCSYYGTCDVPAKLVPLVLTSNHTCNANLKIRSQSMTAQQFADTCISLVNQDAFFHTIVKDNGPVANDNNTSLEVVVFDSYYDYSLYAWEMYNIAVDNGGDYEEGDPSTVGNQARFIAHQATWLPGFQIWNLNHEYTHYLDGRYDMYGDFNAGMSTPTVWWVEGLAEYVSYSYRGVHYDAAVAEAGKGTYALSTLFDSTYDNSDSTRVYNWGYLAVRYMLQSHPQDVDALLAKYRAGDWAGARTLLKTTIGTKYDADFATWLKACAADNCGSLPTTQAPLCSASDTRQYDRNCRRDNVAATTGNYSYNFLNLPAGVKQLTITTSGGTGNADLYYNGGAWASTGSYLAKSTNSGNGETLTIANPPAGYVYFSLYAQQGFSGVTVTTTYN